MDVTSEYVHVRDLKTGYGEVVSEDNSQGLRYACGVMEKLGWPEGVDFVRITIDAFRFPSSSWDISREDLWTYWTETFRPAMLANNRLNPRLRQVITVSGVTHDHTVLSSQSTSVSRCRKKFSKKTFDELDTARLEELYSIASLAKEAMDNIKAELIVRSEATEFGGEPLTGYKVKQGNNATYVSDAVSLEQVVADIPEAYAAPKMKSPAALRALFKDQPEVLAKVNNYLIDRRNKPSLVKVK